MPCVMLKGNGEGKANAICALEQARLTCNANDNCQTADSCEQMLEAKTNLISNLHKLSRPMTWREFVAIGAF